MTEILGSLGLERRTLLDRDGVAIGNTTGEHRPLERAVGSDGAASTPRTARDPVITGATAPAR